MPLDLIFTQAGDFSITDDGIPGNNTSVIRDGNGAVIFTFVHPADALGFTVSTPGVNLTLDITDSLGAANFTVGDLADPIKTPVSIAVKSIHTSGAVVLVAEGSITEGGGDAAADIVAGSIIFSAGSGVGTAGNAIETQTTVIEAETGTGGINIDNTGALTIGGLSVDVHGLDVATSGNISVTTLGSIFLNDADGLESVHGGSTSGNVTLVASGYDADVGSLVGQDAISAPGGSISLSAGRDIFFGTAGLDFDNDVRSRGGLALTAGRDITIDGFADMASDDFGAGTGGGLVAVAGRNINLPGSAGTDGGMSATGSAGADVVLVTGAGGVLNLNAGTINALSSFSGDVIVNADRIAIGAGSGVVANSGTVTLRTVTAGREIVLGSAGEPGVSLNLSDAELDSITTGSLVIGSLQAGPVSVVADIAPLNAPSMEILSGGNVSLQSSVAVAGTLTIRAGDDLYQTAPSTLTANVISAFVDQSQGDAGAGGKALLAGTINGVAGSSISGGGEADTLSGTAGNDNFKALGGHDVLNGGGGNDTLDGGAGNDTMTGGLGNDTYVVSGAADVVVEAVGEGTDEVQSAIAYTLLANFENLTLTGAAAVNGVGNILGNVITGNAGANTLNGAAGNDTLLGGNGHDSLLGGGGADSLDGGAGNDTMAGGAGNDTYVVNAAGDVVTEVVAGGSDTVRTSIDRTIDAEVEKMVLIGAGNIDGTGDVRANTLTGNAGVNTLNGLGGADVLSGGGGADRLLGGGGNDTLVWGAGDTKLDGGVGTDTMKLAENLDLTLLSNGIFENIEQIDMLGGGSDTLKLVKADVLAMSPTFTLKILGEVGDTLELASPFNDLGVTGDFRQYKIGDAIVLVDTDISVFFV